MSKYSRELTVAGGARLLLMLALAVFAPHFFEPQPLLSRLTSQMPALVAAIGIALIIISPADRYFHRLAVQHVRGRRRVAGGVRLPLGVAF